MRIETDLFVLRPEQADDAAALARAFADDPGLAADWGIDDDPTEAMAAAWTSEHADLWERGEGRHLTVADPRTGEMIGGINFHHIDLHHRRAEVGFWLAPGSRGRGIGSAALDAACRWAIERYDLDRVEMTTLPDNAGAIATAEKVGFRREGVLRERNLERGRRVDILMLAVLTREWHPRAG